MRLCTHLSNIQYLVSIPFQMPFSLSIVRDSHQQTNVDFLKCIQQFELLLRQIWADALPLLEAMCGPELL